MAAPQSVIDALGKLVDDQVDLGGKKSDAVAKKAAADEAAHASTVADNAVSAASMQLKDDKKALHDLIDSAFPDE